MFCIYVNVGCCFYQSKSSVDFWQITSRIYKYLTQWQVNTTNKYFQICTFASMKAIKLKTNCCSFTHFTMIVTYFFQCRAPVTQYFDYNKSSFQSKTVSENLSGCGDCKPERFRLLYLAKCTRLKPAFCLQQSF